MRAFHKSAVVVGAAVALLLASSGNKPGLLAQEGASRPGLAWPSPPAPAAIRFLSVLPRPGGESGNGSLFRSLGRVVSSKPAERMVRPLGVAAHQGLVYVADPGSHALLIYDIERNSVHRIAKAGNDALESPVGVAIGGENVYLADSSLKKVSVYDRHGRFLRTFTDEAFARPTGLAFNEKLGRLYVADTAAHQVLVFNANGKLERRVGQRGTAAGEFNYPAHLWSGADDSLLVVDSLNYRVQVLSNQGNVESLFGRLGDTSGEFASPKGIAADSQGHVYVVDSLFGCIQIFNRKGELLLTFGENGTGPGQFWLPAGIFIDDKDRIYVADSYNQRVQVFEFLGEPGEER
ncbi:MAG TPA: L-dopachrome tautomerase-related protein [Candidatus Angelobacter sp.]